MPGTPEKGGTHEQTRHAIDIGLACLGMSAWHHDSGAANQPDRQCAQRQGQSQ